MNVLKKQPKAKTLRAEECVTIPRSNLPAGMAHESESPPTARHTGLSEAGGEGETLECYRHGRRVVLSLGEAVREFWRSNYAWVAPIDFFHWNIAGRAGHACLSKDAGRTSALLALAIMTRGPRALTYERMTELDPNLEYAERSAFHQRAHRLRRVYDPEGNLPNRYQLFENFYVNEGIRGMVQAYRLNPNASAFLVVGVVSGCDPDGVPWDEFLVAPSRSGGVRARPSSRRLTQTK